MTQQSLILAVDRNRRNLELLTQFLGKEGYETIAASSFDEIEQALSDNEVKLVLLDISGFNSSIWNLCEQLQGEQIPFLIISPKQSVAIQQESLAHGARSILVKPLIVKQLLGLIQSLLEN